MSTSPKVSIIIPVYKVENLLSACIDSILNQTVTDIELILVDDGSPDKSPQICDEYANKDPRVKVIHQENSGAPSAMNKAIQMATGKYLWFIDSDDFIENTAIETLWALAEKHQTDCLIFGAKAITSEPLSQQAKNYWGLEQLPITSYHIPFSTEEAINWILSIPTVPWNRFWRHSFIKNNHLQFDEDLKGPYDFMFNIRALLHFPKMLCLKNNLYNYRILPNSTTASLVTKVSPNCFLPIIFFNRVIQLTKEATISPYAKKYFIKRLLEYLNYWYDRVNPYQKRDFFIRMKEALKVKFSPEELAFSNRSRWVRHIHKYSYYQFRFVEALEKYKQKLRTFKRKIWRKNVTTLQKDYFLCNKLIFSKINFQFLIKQKTDSLYRELQNLQTVIKAQTLHQTTFLPYKQVHEGKEVVLVATGPTALQYKPIKDAIHIGVNGATKLAQCKLDYLFVQDFASDKDMNALADNYNKESCKKFYGIHPSGLAKRLYPQIKRIPQTSFMTTNAAGYIIEEITKNNWAFDPSREPLGNFESTVFSALQFILYTHPKRIYLVGCDCSDGYFYQDTRTFYLGDLVFQSWKSFKKFAYETYPDVEIISINPVRLRGMFKDLYQK